MHSLWRSLTAWACSFPGVRVQLTVPTELGLDYDDIVGFNESGDTIRLQDSCFKYRSLLRRSSHLAFTDAPAKQYDKKLLLNKDHDPTICSPVHKFCDTHRTAATRTPTSSDANAWGLTTFSH